METPEFEFNNRTPIKIDRNKLFKGHSMFMDQDDQSKTITLHNNYFNTSIVSTYYIEKDKTETIINAYEDLPKWVRSLVENVNLSLHSIHINGLTCELGNNKVGINSHFMTCHTKFQNKGIAFGNHYDNIRSIKKHKHLLPMFKSRLKELSASDIVSNFVQDASVEYGSSYIALDKKLLY